MKEDKVIEKISSLDISDEFKKEILSYWEKVKSKKNGIDLLKQYILNVIIKASSDLTAAMLADPVTQDEALIVAEEYIEQD